MKAVQFKLRTQGARQLCQLDHNRQILPREKVTELLSENVIACSTEDKTIELEFYLRAKIDLTKLPRGTEPKDYVTALAFTGSRLAISRMPLRHQLNVYDGEWVHLEEILTGPSNKEAWSYEMEAEIRDELFAHLSDVTKRHQSAEAAFERAKEFLTENMDDTRGDQAKLRRAARFLADCMENDNTQYMWAWNSEKAPRIPRGVEDLIRRKNPNHPNYKGVVEQVTSLLYTISPPKLWVRSPQTAWE